MMPGETHSAAPGTAADLSRCQGCASLQQNLNEYVEALITLKQKIINTDNLLTEYQKKCDELQFARRENSTLHHQVEEMLQKISPLQKCQEELGSLKAELEEKKSSLKLYQETHQEYARVKEECLKSDAQKKKLEAKVKKLQEAAVKQTQDFKQLRNEKKILEKEFKKTQERLDEFSKQKNEKELRHIGTQISSDSYGSIDKRKVKLLLKELWLCVNTTHRLPGEGSRCIPEKPAKAITSSRVPGEDGTLPPTQGSPLRTSNVQTCLTKLSMEIKEDFLCQNVEKQSSSGTNCSSDHVFNENGNLEVLVQSHHDSGSTEFVDHDHFFDDDLQAAIDFFKLPPPLLSPVPSPPPMASPHPSSLPSSFAPETFFGEYADSSDNDSVQLRNSAESVSEDDTAESQNYFGSLRKNKGSGTWEEKPKSHEAIQALNTWEVNKVTTAGLETFTATLRESSATHSLVGEKHWTTASQSMSDRKRDILYETKTQMEVREMDKSVQTEKTVHKLTRGLCIERLSASPAQEKEAAPRKSELCCSHLGKRPLNELMESEGKTPLSKMIGSPKSEFTKWTRINEITSEPDCITVSGHFHGLSRELEKEKEDTQGFSLGESPESEDDDSGDAMDVAGLDFETSFSSSSTLVALSVGSNLQSSSRLDCGNDPDITTKVFSTEPPHSEHKLQTKTLNTLHLQSEPPECSIGRNTLENSLRALSPELGASNFNDQKSSGIEYAKVVKDLTKIHSLPRSVFMKATKDGQCESQDPRIELTLNKPDFTSLIGSQAALIKSGLGFVKSTSWHHSDLLRKGGEESLRAKSEHEQKTSQLQKAVPSLQNRGPTPKPNLLKENNNPVEFKTTASVLPNQVSVITKQTRTEKVQSAKLEHLRPHRNEPTLVTENNGNKTGMSTMAECAGEGDDTTQNIREVAAVKSISPEVSASRRKLDFNCAGGSSPVENSDCSTNSRVSFSSENILVQNQDIVREAAVQGDRQKQRQPQATDLDSSGTDGSEVLPATEVTMSGDFSVEKTSCGDTGRSGGEALAVANDSTGTSQNANGLWKLKSTTPGGALLECFGTADTTFSSAFCRKEGETQDTSQSSLPGTLHCYTGIREVGDDTEVEESEAFSCSEGSEQQDAPDDSQKNSGDTDAGVAEMRPSLEHLAECLLHSILSELKIQKISMDHNYIHALCRVYVGICRQLGDLERARLFCYSLLKEDFPESEKLTLFIANMWHDIFLSQSVINKAMQLVARQRAKGEVLNCLRAFLNWEKNAPVDVGFMVSKLLLTIQLCPKTEFQSSEKFGEDLSDNTWEYIFAIDLLCCHQKWIWTHDNIISKELWPVMDKWIKYRKGHANIAYTPDIIIASILRLIGRLGQLGLKEGFPSAVKNISSVIGMFIQHAHDEDIPWGIQLAAVYALCDLSPSNPAEISKILEAWRREASKSVPSAIVSCLEEVSALSTEELG
ncbi:little elongation complex subunit 1 isoform X2 [Papio anubis]|uniref:little elongation complex subunit 1 isoform X2 n=1 Tax=Papio anubis TaxID=9555 RepID=UPI0012AE1633|nr:little elongation complex subunit 1 isoform X2 [Papio anubis]